ncbi:MAG: tetratricopeptide repeat protein [Prevotella shahii]|jgi:tetratricopeptide repeat family protein|uniref:tetratricopeptide repeat protein n=1 Tax=Hoylesella shahii TaxID=228603 RepID=UPI001CB2B101|nr:tetratricopeptide repeat protein [Hoylesella shahii]MBF1568123.1 tetratricopeptide repeat protein [Hoylesella shahii]
MKRKIALVFFALVALVGRAQFNVDRLMTSGQIALHYEDYVLSMQYFNQIISLRPYLYQPWQYRAIAKYYLDDYVGAEEDAAEAIKLNPYIEDIYDLRAISRIRQNKFQEAIIDYNSAIKLNPRNRNYWYNRAACRMNSKDYAGAHHDLDTIVRRWTDYANAYTLKAEVFLHEKDTLKAAEWLDKGLKLDPYDANVWTMRAYISLSRNQWREADAFLSKAIHLKPKNVDSYLNRAIARVNLNNLRGAMADYDLALELDPNNFLGHYNRGLLRLQLGDDNRAIADFDFIIKQEPANFMAVFNRGILHEKTGNIRAAIDDYSAVIKQFPNFWIGLSYRARCYRRLGMTAKAELDDFKILKAQMDKRLGVQARWSKAKLKEVRKRSEFNMDKYNQMVVNDENEVAHEYQSRYRGRVQDNTVNTSLMPMFHLSLVPYANGIRSYQAFDRDVEHFNSVEKQIDKLYVACGNEQLDEARSKHFFILVESLSVKIGGNNNNDALRALLLQRSVAYSTLQNFDAAIADATTLLSIDSTSAMAYWHRAVCQIAMSGFKASNGVDVKLQEAGALSDLNKAIALKPQNAYLYYCRANLYAHQGNNEKAVADYTSAIKLDNRFAEAYFNRGLTYITLDNRSQGVKDLSKAGELGLYSAYNIIKKNSASATKKQSK